MDSNSNNEEPGYSKAERVVPQNLVAEQVLLGSLLLDNNVMEKITDTLSEEYFYDHVHGAIFKVMSTLIARGELANIVTLRNYFIEHPANEEVDMGGYLQGLQDSVLFIDEAPNYAKEIRDCYLRRELLLIYNKMTFAVRTPDPDVSATNIIEESEQLHFALAETNQAGKGLSKIKVALTKALEESEVARKSPDGISGLSTGLRGLDQELGGLQNTDLIIIAGRPGMGKSALAMNIAFHVATTKGQDDTPQPVAFFSLEMSGTQLTNRVLSGQSGVASDDIKRGKYSPEQFTNLVAEAEANKNAPVFIDDTPALSISQILSRARRMKRQHGLSLVVVDYLQMLSAPLGMNQQTRLQEISAITRALKSMAKYLNVPVIALSQLSRKVEDRDNKRPLLSDLRESGTIEQDADVVMFVYRKDYYLNKDEPEARPEYNDQYNQEVLDKHREEMKKNTGITEIIIGKQRHGSTGTVRASFIAEKTKFVDYVSEDHLPNDH